MQEWIFYNILIMEERDRYCGTGAVPYNETFTTENGEDAQVTRVENCKIRMEEYISRIDEMLERKSAGVDSRTLL